VRTPSTEAIDAPSAPKAVCLVGIVGYCEQNTRLLARRGTYDEWNIERRGPQGTQSWLLSGKPGVGGWRVNNDRGHNLRLLHATDVQAASAIAWDIEAACFRPLGARLVRRAADWIGVGRRKILDRSDE
jgi:hypothetical protein